MEQKRLQSRMKIMVCEISNKPKAIAIILILLSFLALHSVHQNHLQLYSPSFAPNNFSASPPSPAFENETGATPHLKYVSLCQGRLTGYHRTGNHLFMLAAMLQVARVSGRILVMPRSGWYLDQIFQLDIPRYDDLETEICPCKQLDLSHFNYDRRFDDPEFLEWLSGTSDSLLLCGLSQTYRYAEQNEYELRRLLQFPVNVSASAASYLATLQSNLTRIAVHVRRGDFLMSAVRDYGLTIADARYFRSAFRYFTDRYSSVNFVVATEDRNWTVSILPESSSKAEINFTNGATAVFDLAVLSKCDGVIMSTGSFGWWAAWLSKKTSVYYAEWPRSGSPFYYEFSRGNYFPSDWVPLK